MKRFVAVTVTPRTGSPTEVAILRACAEAPIVEGQDFVTTSRSLV